MISSGRPSISIEDIYKVTTDAEILNYYLGITKIPCRICSPLRVDKSPSFGLFSPNGIKVTWRDFSSGEHGGTLDLCSKMWNISFQDTLIRIYNDFNKHTKDAAKNNIINTNRKLGLITPKISMDNTEVLMQCKVRQWKKHDIEYWESYGISLEWLKYANVYPISHKIIIKNSKRYVFGADKYAYAYAEFKEGKTTLKIYQPFNTRGFKWSNKHDSSVISLWTKVPQKGDIICICSSLKDALCLWANTNIPSLAIQGEGYNISDTAINELKSRFKKVYILLDRDEPGIKDAEKLASKTGFTNIVLPNIYEAKDISDLYFSLHNKKHFKQIMKDLFNSKTL